MTKTKSRFIHVLAGVFGLLLVASPSAARERVYYKVDISDALASADAKKLDGTVRFYFGDAPHPAVTRTFGSFNANRSTNGLPRETGACVTGPSCQPCWNSRRSNELGANAVTDIHSSYKGEDVSSQTEVDCHSGS